MPETLLSAEPSESRYRVALEISGAIASEPNLQGVFQKVFTLLSTIVPLHAIALLLQEEGGGRARLHALQTDAGQCAVDSAMEVSMAGTGFGRALEQHRPVLIEDAGAELTKVQAIASQLNGRRIGACYALPISTARRALGVLVVVTMSPMLSDSDVEILRCAAADLSLALDSALEFESAGAYQRALLHERDRLKLLLEINNHIMSRLEMQEFFRAASASIRRYFANDSTGFWLLDEESKRLNCTVLDFPSSRVGLARFDIPRISDELMQKLRSGIPYIETFAEFATQFPLRVTELLKAESIASLAHVPLVTPRGPIAAMSLGSRRTDGFSQEDLDLLTQVANQIALALDNALAYERLNASRNHLEDQRIYLESEIASESGLEDIIGRSDTLRRVLDQVHIVAPTDSTVIIQGETGTGKELIARAIHRLSSRADRTFVRLNCASIPSGLLESELFGHEKGAFTGALAQRRGRFELADQGTLFLDEIGDITLDLQPKLLRAIQEREFERLGSSRTMRVNVRMIAATHKDLRGMVRQEMFREDLFYRLNVFPIAVPPLRERREDIPLLVEYFVSRLCRRMQRSITRIPREIMDALKEWEWPGNVRELENFIERAVILSPGDRLNAPIAELGSASLRIRQPVSFRDCERNAIITALKATNGKVAGAGGAADRLDLKRTTLLNKMRRLGISRTSI